MADQNRLVYVFDGDASGLKKAIAEVKGAFAGLSGLSGALGLLLPAASIAGLGAFAKSGIDAADAMHDLALRTQTSVETLSGLRLVAAQNDTSLEALGKAVGKLSAFMGQNAEAAKKLGLTAKDPLDAYVQLAGVLGKAATAQDRAAIANKIFGKTWQETLPTLMLGEDALREQIRLGREAAGVTTDQANAAHEFDDALALVKTSIQGASINLGTKFLPMLNQITVAMKEASKEGSILKTIFVGLGGLGAAMFTDEFKALPEKLAKAQRALHDALQGGGREDAPAVIAARQQIALIQQQIVEEQKLVAEKAKPAGTKTFDDAFGAKVKTVKDSLTRLPTVGKQFDADTATLKAALEVQAGLIEASLQARLISQARYYELKLATDNKQLDLDLARLKKERDAEQANADALASTPTAKLTKNEKANLGDRQREAQTKVKELQSQIDAIPGKRVVLNVDAGVKIALNKQQVQDALNQARAELANATGTATPEQQRALIEASHRDLLTQLINDGDTAGQELVKGLINVQSWQTSLDTLQKSWQLALQTMQNAEQSIDIQQKNGLITQADAQDRIAQAHRDAGVAMDALLPKMEAFAKSINSPELLQSIKAWETELSGVKAVIDPIAASINTDIKSSLTGFLTDIGSAAKTAKEAWLDLGRSILATIQKASSQRIVDTLFPSLSGGGGIGGIISGAMGGKRDGSSLTSALFVQDINNSAFKAAGGANIFGGQPGGDQAGGDSMFSGIWSSITGAFTKFVSGISSFFSNLMSSIGGLFSGGGGGSGAGMGSLISAAASLFGFAEGGWTGTGNKSRPAGFVHPYEFVFDEVSTSRIGVGVLENLRRVASGAVIPQAPRWSYADGGPVNLPQAKGSDVHAQFRHVTVMDPEDVAGAVGQTRSFERAVLNIIRLNPRALQT